MRALAVHSALVGGMFLLGALGFLLALHRPVGASMRTLSLLALLAATAFWAYLYAAKTIQIPLTTGLDGPSHLYYARFIAQRGALPRADDCFSCFHPPLYYLTSAGLLRAFDAERDSEAERRVVKLVPILAGLGMVWLSLLAARRIFPGDATVSFFAVVAASTLPVNIYMSAYVSNEPFHAFLAGASLVTAIGLLLAERAKRESLALLSVLLALTILSKYTGLAIAVIVLAFVALKLFAVEGRPLARVATTICAMGIGIVLLGGWPYFRSWTYFGDPFVWNLDLPGGLSWWQPPSFHTPAYYLHFGQSLVHPYYSMFHSYWDGMYSSLWGEGMPPGANVLAQRHPYWNYDFMSAGYLLALPATFLSIFGFVRLVHAALRGVDGGRCVALALVATLLYVIAFSALQLSVRFPVWGDVRATYVLSLVVPIALSSAVGFTAFHRWLATHAPVLVRAAFYGWLAAFVGVQLFAYGG